MLEQTKIRTIIIEDKLKSQEYIANILSLNFHEIDILGFADSVSKAIKIIDKEKPELIFMDIKLIDGYSFEIFENITYHDFEVIFVTAFDNFVQKAIDHYAFSYIVKPFSEDKLITCVQRYINLKERLFSNRKIELLSNFLTTKNASFLIHVGDSHISIKIDDIIKCEAEGNYTTFHLNSKKTYLASRSLKYYHNLLEHKGFFKAHRSVIVNINYIQSIYKKETIILHNNDKIHVSVRNKSNLGILIDSLS